MEEKINNKKIFNYIPSLILKLILDNPLKDKDVFCEQNKSIFKTNNNYRNLYLFNGNNYHINTLL